MTELLAKKVTVPVIRESQRFDVGLEIDSTAITRIEWVNCDGNSRIAFFTLDNQSGLSIRISQNESYGTNEIKVNLNAGAYILVFTLMKTGYHTLEISHLTQEFSMYNGSKMVGEKDAAGILKKELADHSHQNRMVMTEMVAPYSD